MKYFIFILTVFLFSCSKYEAQYEAPYDISKGKFLKTPFDVCFVMDDQVYISSKFFNEPKKISAATESAKKASANADYTKIAYQPGIYENIVIVDNDGVKIETLPNTEDVIYYGWSGETLYMLDDFGKITFHGPALAVTHTSLKNYKAYTEVYGFSILDNGKVLFVFEKQVFGDQFLFVEDQGEFAFPWGFDNARSLSTQSIFSDRNRFQGSILCYRFSTEYTYHFESTTDHPICSFTEIEDFVIKRYQSEEGYYDAENLTFHYDYNQIEYETYPNPVNYSQNGSTINYVEFH